MAGLTFDDVPVAGKQPTTSGALTFDDVPQQGMVSAIRDAEQAQSRAQMTHATPEQRPGGIYADQAQRQSFVENLTAGAGGATYGLAYLGPRTLLGLDKPGEVEDWKASMKGLDGTAGGTVGQVLGYAAPAAVLAPFAGASVPVAAATGAAEGVLMPADGLGERARNTATSAFGASLGQAGANAIGRRMGARAAAAQQEANARRSQNATRDNTLRASQQVGYAVPPSYAGSGMWTRFMEGISGKYKTNQLAGIQNQRVTNTLAKRDLGLPEDSALSDAVLDDLRSQLAQPYREVVALPQRQQVNAASNYTDWDYPVQQVHGFDPAAALDQLKQARFDSKAYWKHFDRTGDPESLIKARKLDGTVEEMETGLENYAVSNGRPELVDRLREARRSIAKTYTVERALNDATGDVDATALAKMLARNEMVSGDLNTAGKFGMAFHDVARPPKSGDANPFTVLDFWSALTTGGIGSVAAGGPVGVTMALAPAAARVASRYGLLSGPGQRLLAKPNYSIGMVNNRVAPALQSRLAKEFAQGAGIYGYGVQPGLQE